MKSLIVGMGFGNAVYRTVLEQLGHQVVTVDPVRDADFTHIGYAVAAHGYFDTVNICTPNYTHEQIAREVAPHAGIVFVEKPGVKDHNVWAKLVADFPNTRFMMVKNNQYRDTITHFKQLADQCEVVRVVWNSKNRVPNPGSWFTNKEQAFGGVSRDLIPHMLSYYCALTDITKGTTLTKVAEQRHDLNSIVDTDYGTVNKQGIYNVDDYCTLEYQNGNTKWILSANWKDDLADDVYISFGMKFSAVKHSLGLCPESAYKAMVSHAITNKDNDTFWQNQLTQDIWIHQQIEDL
jgi:predicted dehydrogenase